MMSLPKTLVCLCVSLSILSVFTQTAHANSLDGTGATVVVMDPTGIDVTHPEFAGRVVEEVCVAFLNLCPDGSNLQVGKGAAAPKFNSNGSFKNSSGTHGTQVASVAVGKTVGIAPGANLIAMYAPGDFYIAFKWVVDHAQQYKIASVVLSVGQNRSSNKRGQLPCDQVVASSIVGIEKFYLEPLIAQLRNMGIATVIAAGNDSELVDIAWPSCTSGVVSVGTVLGSTLMPSFYSNSSPELSLLAPSGVRTANVGASGVHGYDDNVGGTSMSAPYVAGAIAILKANYPTLTVDQVIAVLRTTGTPIDDEVVKQIPAINVSAALEFLASGKPIPSLASTFIAQAASGNQMSSEDGAKLISSMTNQTKVLKSQLQSREDSNALLSTQISALQKENESLTAKLATAVSGKPARVQSLEDSNALLSTQISALQKENESLTAKLATAVSGKPALVQSLEDSNALLSTQISALQKENESLTAKLATAVSGKPAPVVAVSTIMCIKGKVMWTISAAKPICPSGYKKK